MEDYTKLMEALRACAGIVPNCEERPHYVLDRYDCIDEVLKDAANAIEELQAKVYEKDCFIGMLKVQMSNMYGEVQE